MANKSKSKTRRDTRREYWTSSNGLAIIAGYLRDGASIEEICKKVVRCSKPTIYAWAKKNEELKETLLINRDIADMQVENALFKRATGFKYEETSETSENTYTNQRYCPPDVKAQALWLMNRRGKQWKDKQYIETNQSIQMQQAQDASQSVLAALKAREIKHIAKEEKKREDDSNG